MKEISLKIPEQCIDETRAILEGLYNVECEKPPATILDLGAHIGAFTVWASERWPNATITAYEPINDNWEKLRENIDKQGLDGRVRLHKAAVLDGTKHPESEIEMKGSTVSPSRWSAVMMPARHETNLVEKVTVQHTQQMPSYDFIKCDVEGAELEIFESLDLTNTQAIVVETHSFEIASRLTALLVNKGFKICESYNQQENTRLLKFVRGVSSKQKVMLGTPVYHWVPSGWATSLMSFVATIPKKIPTQFRFVCGDSAVYRARNAIAAEFLDSDCTDLLFIDSDIEFEPWQAERLLSHDVDVVGGPYPKKSRKLEFVCNRYPDIDKPRPDGLLKVRYVGTGFMRIRRRVFEIMRMRLGPSIQYQPDEEPWRVHWHFFPEGPYRDPSVGMTRLLSEDWYFCQNWLDLGGEVWLDTAFSVRHVGTISYPLQLPDDVA